MRPSCVPSFDVVVGVKKDKCDNKSFLQYSSPKINLIRDSFAVVNFSQLSSERNAPVINTRHKTGMDEKGDVRINAMGSISDHHTIALTHPVRKNNDVAPTSASSQRTRWNCHNRGISHGCASAGGGSSRGTSGCTYSRIIY